MVFLSASVLGVLVVLSVYDEDVLTVEHVLTIITILGCVLAGARCVTLSLNLSLVWYLTFSIGYELYIKAVKLHFWLQYTRE